MISSNAHQLRMATLYRELGGFVYHRCLKLLKESDRAADATHDVFVKLMNDPSFQDPTGDPMPLIYRIATCHCLDVLRLGTRRRRKEALLIKWDADPDAVAHYASERQLAAQVLGRFDPTTQAIAVGILIDGMEQGELAAVLGITRQTVARKLDRFLTNARKYAVRSTE